MSQNSNYINLECNTNIRTNPDFESLPSVHDDDLENPNINTFSKKLTPTLTMNRIIPRLYLGDDLAARNREILKINKITHILNLTTNIPNKFEPDIIYLKLVILDYETQNISQYFSETFEFIDNALKDENNSVLVHCNAGISRSASFIIAYLMQKGLYRSYRDAHEHVKKCRPIICPNRGFERQLLNLDRQIKKKKMCILM